MNFITWSTVLHSDWSKIWVAPYVVGRHVIWELHQRKVDHRHVQVYMSDCVYLPSSLTTWLCLFFFSWHVWLSFFQCQIPTAYFWAKGLPFYTVPLRSKSKFDTTPLGGRGVSTSRALEISSWHLDSFIHLFYDIFQWHMYLRWACLVRLWFENYEFFKCCIPRGFQNAKYSSALRKLELWEFQKPNVTF